MKKIKFLILAALIGGAFSSLAFLFALTGTVDSSLPYLIASESFSVPEGYCDNISFGDVNNVRNNLIGNAGFSDSDLWQRSTALIVSSGLAGLTHPLMSGSAMSGSVKVVPGIGTTDRYVYRDLEQTPTGKSFYMSGLVSLQGSLNNILTNSIAAMGLSTSEQLAITDETIPSGIFLGLSCDSSGDVFLSVFAAGNTYRLGGALTTNDAVGTHMISLKLDIGSGATDSLTAWYARADDAELVMAGSWSSLDIAESGKDIQTFGIKAVRTAGAGYAAGVMLDEWRFFGMDSLNTENPLQTDFWVSPAPVGNDYTGSGTSNAPWATISKARDNIYLNNWADIMTSNITVNITAGEYVLTRPLDFTTVDSGDNGHYIIYRAADGPGTVNLVGSSDLNGWEQTQYSTNIWKIYIGPDETVDSVFENNVRGQLARSPNREMDPRYPMAHAPYRISVDGGYDAGFGSDWLEYEPGEYPVTDFTNTAQLVWWIQKGTRDWGMGTATLLTNDTQNNVLYFDALSTSYSPSSEERYFVQGIQGLLDAPGEFYYSPSAGWLYYYPRTVGNPDVRDMRVPLSYSMLISVQGSAPGIHAHHIKFEGLTLNYISGRADRGAINLEHTDHIEVRDCHILNAGRYAIHMRNDNSRNLVYGCWIEHCGVGGILVRNDLQRVDSPNDKSEFNMIANCKIHDLGERSVVSTLTAGVSLFNTSDCEVSNCEIYNSARYAITLRGHWSSQYDPSDIGTHFSRNNTFQYIRAFDCMNDSGDGAIVHAAHCNGAGDSTGTNNINYWNQIVASGAYADPSMLDWAPNGIFFDHPQSCLYQSLSNIQISWIQGENDAYHSGNTGIYRGNLNPIESQTTSNLSFYGTFNEGLMDYSEIGLKADFSFAYDSREALVCDDHTVDYSESVGWVDSAVGGRYKGDARYYIYAGNTNALAQWVPSFPFTRKYEVSIWRTAPSTGASTCAPYEIYYQNGSANVTLNQQSGSGWVSIGTYPFVAGRDAENGVVYLYAHTADELAVRADAVKFTEVDLLDSGALGEEKGWWGFEQTAADGSSYDHDGISQNIGYSTWSAEGDYSAYFNSTGYVSVVDHSDLDIGMGDFSIALWFRRTSDPAENLRILSKGAQSDSDTGYCIYGSDTGVVFALSDGASRRKLYGTHTAIDEWNRIVVNISRNGYMKLYINGSLADEMNILDWKDIDISNSRNLNIGRSYGGYNWVGRIDDVALFQRVLSEREF